MPNGVEYPFQTLNITTSTFSINTTSTQIAPANANRRKIIIRNDATGKPLFLSFVSPAVDDTANIIVPQNQQYEMTEPEVVWTGAIYAVFGTLGAQNVVVTDFSF